MNLIPAWRRLWYRFWSVRLSLLAAALGAAEAALPRFSEIIPPGVFLVLSVGVAVAAASSRLVAQPEAHKKSWTGSVASATLGVHGHHG